MYNNPVRFYQLTLLVTKMQSLRSLLQAEVNPLYSSNPEQILKIFLNKVTNIYLEVSSKLYLLFIKFC